MTKQELTELIKATTLPLLKDAIGKDVADAVREQVDKTIASARKTASWPERLFSGEERPVERAKGTDFARCVRATAAAKLAGQGPDFAISVLEKWGDHDLAARWQGAREKALGTGDPTAGGFLVPPQFSTDVIELLRPAAVVRSLNPLVLPMPNGTLKVPKITTGATAGYIGENTNITKTEEKFGQLTLTWKKLAALVPISNDLIRYSSPNADAVVRDDVVRALAAREDKGFLVDDGMSGTPKGLRNWVNASNKLACTGGAVTLANVTIDLGRCIQAIMSADIPLYVTQNLPGQTSAVPGTSNAGWLFSPRTFRYLTTVQTTVGAYVFRDEMLRGTLWGFPYRVTTQLPETYTADQAAATGGSQAELLFGAFAHAVIGEALGLQVDSSMEAAYHDGSAVVAAFSQDQTVIRVIAEHDFALRHDKAFVHMYNLSWGA